ncbi:MAG: leucine-rich repeat domain-containing protein [Peptococcaceae bacterium]|jgi:Leucine-rich repeat (LRR) protein|nr:leucine-rich repeat domain-containing protein [Peptococcaceae bacterium]
MKRCSARPYEGGERYIFVSYCHKDRRYVLPVIETLARAGYRIWYDEGIDPGSEWPEVIAEHLSAASVCVAFISENSAASHNCRREVSFALLKQKTFLSVFLEPVKLSPGTEMQLAATQSVFRYSYDRDEDFFQTLRGGQGMAGCVGAPNPDIIISDPSEYVGEEGQFRSDSESRSFKDEWFTGERDDHSSLIFDPESTADPAPSPGEAAHAGEASRVGEESRAGDTEPNEPEPNPELTAEPVTRDKPEPEPMLIAKPVSVAESDFKAEPEPEPELEPKPIPAPVPAYTPASGGSGDAAALDAERKRFRKTRRKKRRRTVLAVIGAVIVGLAALMIIITAVNSVNITGAPQTYRTSEKIVKIELDELAPLPEGELKKLAKMPKLVNLTISNCDLTDDDIAFLGTLTELKFLRIYNAPQVTDISPLANLAKLDTLYVVEMDLENLGGVDVAKLSRFNCAGNRIQELPDLRDSHIYELIADDNGLTSLAPLLGNAWITHLDVSGNNITSTAGLDYLTKLEYLDLSGNPIEDVSVLEKSAATLKYLYLQDMGLKDITFAARLITLKRLDLSNNEITDLSALNACSELQNLWLDHNRLSVLDLGGCRNLENVSAAYNNITDIVNLRLKNTAILDLSHNEITDIRSLPFTGSVAYLDQYRALSLYANPIADFSRLATLKGDLVVLPWPEGAEAAGYFDTPGGSFKNAFALCVVVGAPVEVQPTLTKNNYHVLYYTAEETDAFIAEKKAIFFAR